MEGSPNGMAVPHVGELIESWWLRHTGLEAG